MKRSAVIISIIFTTIILGGVGGVVKSVSAANQAVEVQKLQATIQAREELYTQSIIEANARIQQANQEIQTIQQQPTPTALAVDQALQIAIEAAGESGMDVTGHTEMVNYNGIVSYEVQLSDGSILYLDAVSGSVLYNSLTGGPGKVIDDKQALFDAVTYMKGGQVVSVEKSSYENQPAYLVTFSDGTKVYVNLAGQIIGVVQVQVYTTGYTAGTSSSSDSYDSSSSKPRSNSYESDESESDDD